MKTIIKTLKSQLHGLRPLSFLLLFTAGVINAVGVTMFLAPVHLYDSGISGTAMLLWQVTPESWTLSLFLLLLNTPLFLFGWKKQGTVFTVCSLWVVFVYSAASFVITNILPVDVSAAFSAGSTKLLLTLTVYTGSERHTARFYEDGGTGEFARVIAGTEGEPEYGQTCGWRVGTLMMTCEGTRIQDERGNEQPTDISPSAAGQP